MFVNHDDLLGGINLHPPISDILAPFRVIDFTFPVWGILLPSTLNVLVDEYPELVAVTEIPGEILTFSARIRGFPTATAILPVLRDTLSSGFVQ